ncbi:MAG: bifunctional glutamate N-acetyltransferase/amino-acid acetyltransferase ArgJ [Spirochaetes bacterium]|nr:bifunctional glutamate N-acetyltransferase/amino-acid acetyltransferase ArgJ [Spirochaetota bacterium]
MIKKTNNHFYDNFEFNSVSAEIKYKNRDDFALIFSKKPCNAAAVFTKNLVKASPLKVSSANIKNKIRAVLVNSGNANAATGTQGMENALKLNQVLSEKLNIPSGSILQCSTGVIGIQLPVEKMINSLPALVEGKNPDKADFFSKAIMTTDTFNKISTYEFSHDNINYRVTGIAKGAGMIAPDMATLLAFILTDFPVSPDKMDTIFRAAADSTLNAITVDGDTSTNDTAILLSPENDSYFIDDNDLSLFREALTAVMSDLAYMLIKDAEGATKCVKISCINAKSENDARLCSRAIAQSMLVKTAIFGEDPNWGRIACAAGYSGADFNPDNISISFNNIVLLDKGSPLGHNIIEAEKVIKNSEYTITIDLNEGNFNWTFLTSDLSYDYVKINAEYTT